MKKIQALLITLAMGATLAISAAAFSLNPQNTNQSAEACCDMKDCCKAGAMSCCKKKRKGKNAHACCKEGNGAACCCKGDSCPMPNKKTTGNSNGN